MRPSSRFVRIGLLLLALLPAACRITDNAPAGKTTVSIDADATLLQRDSVVVILKASNGADTLFRGKLAGLDTLRRLPASDFDGGHPLVIIQGFQGGALVYEERLDYAGGAQKSPTVEVPLDLTAGGHRSSLDISPDQVKLFLGGASTRMRADPHEVWNGKTLIWTTGDTTVAIVSQTGEVTPVGAGFTYVRATSGDTASDASAISVVLGLPVLDSLSATPSVISIKDAVSFQVRITSGGTALRSFAWDFDGDGRVDQAGNLKGDTATLMGVFYYSDPGAYKAKLRVTDANGDSVSASVTITVKLDRPTADAGADFSVPGGEQVRLRGRGTDTLGRIVTQEWKIGSKNFAPASDSGILVFTAPDDSEIIPCVFRVSDDDGLTAEDTVIITINNGKAPSIASFLPRDTAITIKDEASFAAQVEAVDADLKSWTVDVDGDGNPEARGDLSGRSQPIRFKWIFPNPGIFNITLKVLDRNGLPAAAKARVTVLLDAPKADAGPDTNVAEGSPVNLHGRAKDSLGAILRMEWKIGSGAFAPVSKGDTTITAPATAGSVPCIFRVMDDDSLVVADTLIIRVKASANAALAALAISPAGLAPGFSPDSGAYKASVDNSVAAVTLTPTAANAGARLMMNGSAIESGKPIGPIGLSVGANVFNIIVTAEDGATSKVYSVSVFRAPSANADLANLVLSAGLLVPEFASGTTAYAATVSNPTDSLKVTPTAAGAGSTLKVNGATVVSGAASRAIALSEGANAITVEATAQDGITKKTYTVNVTRLASANALLTKLALSSGFLTPAFASGTMNYSVSVANAIDSIKVTPTSGAAGALIKVNGDTVVSAIASKSIALSVGADTIKIEVTAPDGINKNTYTLIVTRAANNSANLSNLVMLAGTLSPPFAPGTTVYFDTIPNGDNFITVTATVAAAGAKLTVNDDPATSGRESLPIDLLVGAYSIPVVVTAPDGITRKTYTVRVVRLRDSNTDLSNLGAGPGTFSPAFAAATTSYTLTVPYATDSISITAKAAATTSLIKVNGTYYSGAGLTMVALPATASPIPIEVTAQDGTKKTYSLTVIRAAPSSNAKLSALAVSGISLSPAFDPAVLDYNAIGSAANGSVIFQPTAADANATLALDGSPLASGKASPILAVPYGTSNHAIVVTAQDGATRKTYGFTIWRAGADDFISGYALVDDYSASHALTANVYNSAGAVTFTRTATGKYAVAFAGLASIGNSEGIVHATAFAGPAFCKVVGSANSGSDLIANIACFGMDGNAADSRVSVIAQFPRSSATGRNAYALADSPSTASYLPSPGRSYSSVGAGGFLIAREAAGTYHVTVKGMDLGIAEYGNAMVTAYGSGNTRCELQGWQLIGGDARVDVACIDPATGARQDSPFNISYMQVVSGSVSGVATAVVSGAAADNEGPFAFNTGGGAIKSEELATGSYRITFAGLGAQGGARPGNVQVNTSAATAPNQACTVEDWSAGADFVASVRCWDNTGSAASGSFTIQVLK